jgi:hypothetical protein
MECRFQLTTQLSIATLLSICYQGVDWRSIDYACPINTGLSVWHALVVMKALFRNYDRFLLLNVPLNARLGIPSF